MPKQISHSYIPLLPDRPSKVAIFADSHANDKRFASAIRQAARLGPVDAALHLGDHASDAALLHELQPEWPVFAVRGNNDYDDMDVPNELLLSVGKIHIYASHGHQQSAAARPYKLAERARALGAQVACFGHTHIAFLQTIDHVLVANPGSVSYPRGPGGAAFALASINDTRCEISIMRVGS